MLKKFVGFAGVGAIATAIQYLLLVILAEFAAIDPVYASAIGYAISATLNYLMKYHLVFASDRRHREAAPRYAAISGVGLLLNTSLMQLGQLLLGAETFQDAYLLVQLVVTGLVLLWNFFANAHWTFRVTGHQEKR